MSSCPKGQVELILQICNIEPDIENSMSLSTSTNESKDDETSKNRWTISDVTRRLTSRSRDKYRGLCFKITTSKMRCSIKVKEDFENIDSQIYVKTTIFEHEILSNSWKSDLFAPSLSTRWSPDNSTVTIPLNNERDLDHISIKVYLKSF